MAREIPNLTRGSIVRSLLTLAVPIVFAKRLQTAYQLIDTFWVGAVAAVSLSFAVIFFLIESAACERALSEYRPGAITNTTLR